MVEFQSVTTVKRKIKKMLNRMRGIEEPRILQDPFVDMMCLANPGMQDRGNIWLFDYALSHLPSASPMLEIGSFCGLSANIISYFKMKHKVANKLFCCDAWNFEFEGAELGGNLCGHHKITRHAFKDFCKSSFIRNVSFFSSEDIPTTIEADSDRFFQMWSQNEKTMTVFDEPAQLGGPLSFAFIDGNHSYIYAKRDFENVDRFLEKGGLILFDDSYDGADWEVTKVVAEVMTGGKYQLLYKNPNYLFKKIV